MRVDETPVIYALDVIMVDAFVGVAALALIVVTALLAGGFSFFTPWLIVCPLAMLSAGLVRSRSEGNIWQKSLVISLASLLGIAVFVKPLTSIGITAPLLILPCVGGVWFRRRRPSIIPSE